MSFVPEDLRTMQVQTQDLIGPALDWAVAFASSTAAAQGNFALARAQADIALARGRSYSTDWAIGGCILESEDIELRRVRRPGTVAWEAADGCDAAALAEGPTRLIAAMRCFVMGRLGAQVEVPDAVVAMSAQIQHHAYDSEAQDDTEGQSETPQRPLHPRQT